MIYVTTAALERIEVEVQSAQGIETGGILIGVFLKSGDVLVTHATSPGPKAIKTTNLFQKDLSYTTQIFNILSSKYSIDYLGEWHKHPNSFIDYSLMDKKSMVEITEVNSRPCFFAIVGNSYSLTTCQSSLRMFTCRPNLNIDVSPWEEIKEPEKLALEKGINRYVERKKESFEKK